MAHPPRYNLLDGLGDALVEARVLKPIPAKKFVDAIRASDPKPANKKAPAETPVAKKAPAKKPAAAKKSAVQKTIAKKPAAAKN